MSVGVGVAWAPREAGWSPGASGHHPAPANLPVIEHPMARLDRRAAGLAVRGLSRGSPIPGIDPAVAGSPLPTLGADHGRDWTGRSLPRESGQPPGGRSTSRIVNTPDYSQRIRRREGDLTSTQALQELEYALQEKLTSGYHGLRHLFKANDPKGQGVVSREALLKIIYTTCGYVTRDLFNRLLKGTGLNGKANISFEDFINCFKEQETSRKVWLSPTQKVEIQEVLRRSESRQRDRGIPATLCFSLLKEKARAREYRIQDLLPQSCFEPGGLVIQPQLLDMTQHLGFKLSQEEFAKLWQRLDSTGSGAVKTSHLLKLLALNETGSQCSTRTLHVVPRMEILQHAADTQTMVREGTTPRPREESGHGKGTTRVNHTPRMDRVTDCLHIKFEQSYNTILQGMQCFDFLQDGFIARIDFKKVLEEFGMPVTVIDLDYFFSRCGVRSLRGQVAYRDFLLRFWSRTDGGVVGRILRNAPHLLATERPPPPADRGRCLSVEELETRLVEYLHGHFLTLLAKFKTYDQNHLGLVTKDQFRAGLETTLGYGMSDRQWADLTQEAGLNKDVLVPYTPFLESFSKPPGQWNRHQVGPGVVVTQVRTAPPTTPAQVAILRADAHSLLSRVQEEVAVDMDRSERLMRQSEGLKSVELTDVIKQFFKFKFHSFDKMFKDMDRHMTGRLNVHQFAMILKQCGLVLMASEVETLWQTLPVAADNMLSFGALLRHVNTLNKGHPAIRDRLTTENTIDQERKSQKLKETEQVTEQPLKVETARTNERECDKLLERLRPEVVRHWGRLKTAFRQLDPGGATTVRPADIKDLLKMLGFSLADPEADLLVGKFSGTDTHQFNYMEFLKHYTKHQAVSANMSETLQQMLMKEWKHVRRALRRKDPGNHGYLSVEDFRSALAVCDVNVSQEDLYHILSEFDRDLNGRISYEHFLSQIC